MSTYTGTLAERGSARLASPLIVAALVLLPMLAGDRQGFEGDGLAMLFGMDQFGALGRAGVYRYHWQPLSYELVAALHPLFGRPFSQTYVAQAFGGAGLALLYLLLTRLFSHLPHARGLALVMTLCVPELWVTTLYFNTSALALPFVTGSLLALQWACAAGAPVGRAVLAGMLMAAGCLFRLDFLALVPAVLVLPWWWAEQARMQRLLGFVAGGLAVAGAFLAWQPHFITDAATILQRYGEGEFSVTLAYRLKILLFALGPALLIYPLLWWTSRPREAGRGPGWPPRAGLLFGAALIPTLAPLNNLYSGKYLLPFFLGLTVLMAQLVARNFGKLKGVSPQRLAHTRLQTGAALAAGLLVVLALVGIPAPEALKSRPLTAWFVEPMAVGTHDGARPAGAYLGFLHQLRQFELPQNSVRFYKELSDVVNLCRSDATVLMSPVAKYGQNEWSWGWLPLYLMQQGWQLREYQAGRQALLEQPASARRVRILASGQHVLEASSARLDLAGVGLREDYMFWSDALRWIRNPATRARCLGNP
jgi:hypothetical protein